MPKPGQSVRQLIFAVANSFHLWAFTFRAGAEPQTREERRMSNPNTPNQNPGQQPSNPRPGQQQQGGGQKPEQQHQGGQKPDQQHQGQQKPGQGGQNR
jgi:hypothetical protein